MARGVTGRNTSRAPAWRPTSHPLLAAFSLTREKALAPLFTDGWRPDCRRPSVLDIHERCAAWLRRP